MYFVLLGEKGKIVWLYKECNDLALAYANRSACYQKLGCYQMALRDIELALTSGYPEDKAFKLEERKGELTSFSREPHISIIYWL